MLGLPVLDVAIGMAFIYLLFALMCTTVNEIIAGAFDKRAKMLRESMRILLGSEFTKTLYEHPAIASLGRRGKKDDLPLPSYIPADRFAQAVADHVTGEQPITNLAAARKGINQLPQATAKQLHVLLELSRDDPHAFQARVQEWYEQMMDRVSGWYKRDVQRQTYVLAAILVLLFNLDSIALIERLWSDSALRSTVVEQAKTRIQASDGVEMPVVDYTGGDTSDAGRPVQTGTVTMTDSEKQLLSSLGGWQEEWSRLNAQLQLAGDDFHTRYKWFGGVLWRHFFGWVLTVVALSLGASFWFDTLNLFMNIRSAGRAPDEPRSKQSNGGKEHAAAA
jgi:hypothetical protein